MSLRWFGERPRGRVSKAGMTLLECLMYVAIMGVVINISISLFRSSTRISAHGVAVLDRLNSGEEVRTAFLRTVHEAARVADGVAGYKTGGDRIVFEMPPAPEKPDERHYVVFGCVASKERVGRLNVSVKNGEAAAGDYISYALPVKTVNFEWASGEPAAARLVTARIQTKMTGARKDREPIIHTFSGALRCVPGGSAGAEGRSS